MLFLIQGGLLMAQTETLVTVNGKKVMVDTNTINTADNGLTAAGRNVQLSGSLIQATTLTTTPSFTLAITGLQDGLFTDRIVVQDGSNVLKTFVPANAWNLLGNSGTNPTANFLGTIDNQDFQFKINNTNAGRITADATAFGYNALNPASSGLGNTAFGVSALAANTSGRFNIAIGNQAMLLNTSGYSNVAFGNSALKNNTTNGSNVALGNSALENNSAGYYNVAVGNSALAANTNKSNNTALGDSSLMANSTGGSNTTIGYSTLMANTSGGSNTAIGADVMKKNDSGESNVAIGYGVLKANISGVRNVGIGNGAFQNTTTASRNVAVGSGTPLGKLTTGYENVALGNQAMGNSTTTFFSTAVGEQALFNLDNGSQNVALGYNAGSFYGSNIPVKVSQGSVFVGSSASPAGDSQSNQVVIGYNAKGRGNNTVQIGNTSMTSIGGQVAWSNPSDVRLKKEIKDSEFGLNFINKLRPVTYLMKTGPTDLQTGFIAQEVEAAAKSIDYNFSGIVKPQSKDDFYSLRYAEFVVPLVKAVQEQQKQLDEKEAKIAAYEKRLLQLKEAVKQLTATN